MKVTVTKEQVFADEEGRRGQSQEAEASGTVSFRLLAKSQESIVHEQ